MARNSQQILETVKAWQEKYLKAATPTRRQYCLEQMNHQETELRLQRALEAREAEESPIMTDEEEVRLAPYYTR